MTAWPDGSTAHAWLEQARRDLDKASAMHESAVFEPGDVCASAQQSAEKSLKAVLLHEGGELHRTHDLRELRSRCAASLAPHVTDEYLDALSALWTSSRYPGDWPQPTQADAGKALEVASALYVAAADMIAMKEDGR